MKETHRGEVGESLAVVGKQLAKKLPRNIVHDLKKDHFYDLFGSFLNF